MYEPVKHVYVSNIIKHIYSSIQLQNSKDIQRLRKPSCLHHGAMCCTRVKVLEDSKKLPFHTVLNNATAAQWLQQVFATGFQKYGYPNTGESYSDGPWMIWGFNMV